MIDPLDVQDLVTSMTAGGYPPCSPRREVKMMTTARFPYSSTSRDIPASEDCTVGMCLAQCWPP